MSATMQGSPFLATSLNDVDRIVGPRRASFARVSVACVFLAVLFSACLTLYTRNNTFPVYYHEDESTKAYEVTSNTRNLNHPLLMLEVTRLFTASAGTPKDVQSTVEAGRTVNAAFAAAAACVMAVLGYRMWGLTGLLLAGIAVGLCPATLVFSHYMKEDASLVFGVCLAILSGRLVWERREDRRNLWAVICLGVACGLAASGKYVGILVLVMSVPFVVATSPRGWRSFASRAGLLLIASIVTWGAVNCRAVAELHTLADRVKSEERHATTQHRDLTMSRPTLYHAAAFVRQCMPHVWLLSSLYVVLAVARARRERWDLCLVLFAAVYLFVISWSVLPFFRYTLPVIVIAHFAAAAGVAWACGRIERATVRRMATALAIVGLVALQLPRCFDFVHQFGDDSRVRLREWVEAYLPADAVFVEDDHVWLDQRLRSLASRPAFVPRVIGDVPGPEMGDLDRLRRIGVDYVAVTEIEYGPYFNPFFHPAKGMQAAYAYRREWYESLFREELVWSSEPAHPMFSTYNNPTIRLYKLRR